MFIQKQHSSDYLNPLCTALMSCIDEAVIALDTGLKITVWNSAAEKIYGWKSDEVMGKEMMFVLSSRLVNGERDTAINSLRDNGSFSGEVLHKKKDRSDILIFTTLKEIRDPAGKVLGIVCVNRDLTREIAVQDKIRENSRQLLNAISNSLTPRSIFKVPGGELLYVNDAFKRLFSLSDAHEWYNKTLAELKIIGGDDNENLLSCIRSSKDTPASLNISASGNDKTIFKINICPVEWYDEKCVLADYFSGDLTTGMFKQNELLNIFSKSALPKIIFSAETGEVKYANQAYETFFGVGKDKLTVLPVSNIGVYATDKEVTFLKEPAADYGGSLTIETQVETALGKKDVLLHRETIEWQGSPCFIIRFIEITAHKKNERLKMYSGLISNLPTMISILHFEDINEPRSLRVVATNAKQPDAKRTVGMYVRDLSPDTFTNGRVDKYLEMLRNGTPADLGVIHIAPSYMSKDFYFHALAFPLSVDTICLSLEDVTEQKKKEEELGIFNAQLTEAQRMASMGTWEWDISKNTISCSDEFCNLFELQTSQHSGTVEEFINLVHPDDREFVTAKLRAVTVDKAPFEIFHRVLRADGTERIIRNRARAFADESGKLIRVFGIAQDLTDEKMAEEKFVSLLESIPESVIIVNENGKIIIANNKAESVFGIKRLKLQGKKITVLASEHFHAQFNAELKNYVQHSQDSESFEMNFCSEDNKEFPVEINFTRILNDEEMWIAVIIRDISERKNIENDLRKKTHELFRSNKQVEELNYVTSHDLQEPLRNIINYIGLFERSYKGRLDDETSRYLEYIVKSAAHMKRLIAELLEFSALGKDNNNVVVHSGIVVKEVIGEMKNHIEETGTKIIVGQLPTIIADYADMKRIFRNLISNAIKFRKDSEAAEIRINCVKSDETWIFSVADNGIGIEKRFTEKVFHIFQRLHTQEKYKGLGIGLSVCKKIVNYNGGSIWVESEPGKGSVFYFTIPVN